MNIKEAIAAAELTQEGAQPTAAQLATRLIMRRAVRLTQLLGYRCPLAEAVVHEFGEWLLDDEGFTVPVADVRAHLFLLGYNV